MLTGSWPGARLDRCVRVVCVGRGGVVSTRVCAHADTFSLFPTHATPTTTTTATRRVLARLHGWRLSSIEMVGTSPLPGGVTYSAKVSGRGGGVKTLPVLPSDHFGLLAKLEPV